MKRCKFFRKAAEGKVLAKADGGRLIYARGRVGSNTEYGISTWREFDSVEEAAKALGVPVPQIRRARIYPPSFMADGLDRPALRGYSYRDIFDVKN